MALEALKKWDLSRDNPLAKNGYHAYAWSHRISWPNRKHIFNVTRRHVSYGYLTCEKKQTHIWQANADNHNVISCKSPSGSWEGNPGKWDIQISCYKLVPPTLLSWFISRLTRVYCRYVYTLMNLEPNNHSWLFIICIYIIITINNNYSYYYCYYCCYYYLLLFLQYYYYYDDDVMIPLFFEGL